MPGLAGGINTSCSQFPNCSFVPLLQHRTTHVVHRPSHRTIHMSSKSNTVSPGWNRFTIPRKRLQKTNTAHAPTNAAPYTLNNAGGETTIRHGPISRSRQQVKNKSWVYTVPTPPLPIVIDMNRKSDPHARGSYQIRFGMPRYCTGPRQRELRSRN
jgi:hypothetical protein